jgi:hypothetical protein
LAATPRFDVSGWFVKLSSLEALVHASPRICVMGPYQCVRRLLLEWDIVLDYLNLSRLLVHTNAASKRTYHSSRFPTKTMQQIPPMAKSSIYGSIATGFSVGVDRVAVEMAKRQIKGLSPRPEAELNNRLSFRDALE